ncbi:MAG: methylenetetrahydrofolate reductase C-terminal domain-containing protein [Thermoplasmata archaeon]|nr:methylenetetrahydrofolate reductase C-terminal domain-containing protein [Thermoplasmata archaeon]
MIIGERKPFEEIIEMIGPNKKILVLGCSTCVTVCFAGGEKEAGILAAELRIATKQKGQELETDEFTIERQCENEFAEAIREKVENADVVLSLACGIGVQTMAEIFPDKAILPALNTTFMGWPEKAGVWVENCKACGDCVLHLTAGICPMTRCSKNILNGPCGGTTADGKCEVDPDTDCAWLLIYRRLKDSGRLEEMEVIRPLKDWRPGGHGGPRKIVREDLTEEHLVLEPEPEPEPEETGGAAKPKKEGGAK